MKVTCGIYLYNIKTNNFLLCHATMSRGGWSIPKGLKDEGEDCYTAASRELKEETNIDIKDISILEKHQLPPVKYKKQNKVLESFLIITDTQIDDTMLKCTSLVNGKYPEIDKFKWVTLDELKTLAHESQAENAKLINKLIH